LQPAEVLVVAGLQPAEVLVAAGLQPAEVLVAAGLQPAEVLVAAGLQPAEVLVVAGLQPAEWAGYKPAPTVVVRGTRGWGRGPSDRFPGLFHPAGGSREAPLQAEKDGFLRKGTIFWVAISLAPLLISLKFGI
jgi:hypothetical protein